jgi:hypothetical protein
VHSRDNDGVGDIAQRRSDRSLCTAVDVKQLSQWPKHAGYSFSRTREVCAGILARQAKLECFHACGDGGAVAFRGRLSIPEIFDSSVSSNKFRLCGLVLFVETEFARIKARDVDFDALELSLR